MWPPCAIAPDSWIPQKKFRDSLLTALAFSPAPELAQLCRQSVLFDQFENVALGYAATILTFDMNVKPKLGDLAQRILVTIFRAEDQVWQHGSVTGRAAGARSRWMKRQIDDVSRR
jgi:hypothetical protein